MFQQLKCASNSIEILVYMYIMAIYGNTIILSYVDDDICMTIRSCIGLDHWQRSGDSLLAKCTHGGSQTPNKDFHYIIWSRCPVKLYNDGEMGSMQIFSNLGLAKGDYMKEVFHAFDRKIMRSAENQVTEVAGARKRTF